MSQFCCECNQWEGVLPQISGDHFGMCHDTSVAMKVALDGKTKLGDQGTLFTQSYFGCIHWRKNDGSLVSTNRALKEDEEENWMREDEESDDQ